MADEAHLGGPSLQRFLNQVEGSRGGTVTAFRPISGGYSRLSALATVRWADGAEESFVLRSDPPPDTGVFVSDRDDEWRLLKALSGKLPVRTPTPRWYDAGRGVFRREVPDRGLLPEHAAVRHRPVG